MSVRISSALAVAITAAGCGNSGPQDAEQVPVFEEAPLAAVDKLEVARRSRE